MAVHSYSLVIKGNIAQAREAARAYRIDLVIRRHHEEYNQTTADCRVMNSDKLHEWFGRPCVVVPGFGSPAGTLLLFTEIDGKTVAPLPPRQDKDGKGDGWHHDA